MTTQQNTEWLRTISWQNGLQLTDHMLGQYEALVAGLLDWNRKINLISRRDKESVWSAHILHCLSPLFKIEIPESSVILDLGTGGGLPGLPLKIARPDLRLTLLDSTQKKIHAVQAIAKSLGLEDLTVVWGRAEDLGRQQAHAKKYDLVIARAVAPLKDLVHWSVPFLNQLGMDGKETEHQSAQGKKYVHGQTLIALKGGDLEEEISQIRRLAVVKEIETIHLTLRGSRQLEEGEKKIVLVAMKTSQKEGNPKT